MMISLTVDNDVPEHLAVRSELQAVFRKPPIGDQRVYFLGHLESANYALLFARHTATYDEYMVAYADSPSDAGHARPESRRAPKDWVGPRPPMDGVGSSVHLV